MDNILGVKISNCPKTDLYEYIKKSVDTNKKTHIVTLNTEMLIATKKDKKLAKIINQAQLVVPESSGLYLADNYLGSKNRLKPAKLLDSTFKTLSGHKHSLQERISGVDFCLTVAGLAEEFGYKLLLLGGQDGVAVQAAQNLRKQFPKLEVTGDYGGEYNRDQEKILKIVKQTQPDVIFVAFGPPKQEYWIAENLEKIPAKVAVGVGGTLDFMAGEVPRAPKLVRNIGLEWAFRLAVQPWRIKRQFALISFIKLLLKEG